MDTIRIAMIGAGFIGGLFAESAGDVAGVELAGVHTPNPAEADAFAERYGIPRVYRDLAALAADDSIDAVYVASPNSVHAEQAIQMLQAGKHVLVEKPMGLNAAQATAMIEAAHRSGRLLMEAYRAAFEPNIVALRDGLARIPQVRRAVLIMDQYSSRFDAYKAGKVLPAFDPAFGGGSIMDLGFYPVSLAVHLFGEPKTVTATGLLLDSGADGQGTILLGYDGFEVACLHSKISTPGIDSQIAGELGAIVLDDCAAPTRVRLVGRESSSSDARASRHAVAAEDLTRERSGGFLTHEIAEFAHLVQAGALESALHPLANSLATMKTLDEARRQVGVRFPADQDAGAELP